MFNRRRFKDSGIILHLNSTLTSNNIWVVNLNKKWEPYDELSIVNMNDDNDILAEISSDSFAVPKGSQRQITQLINNLSIKNIGTTTITAEDIRIEIRHTGRVFR